MVAVTGASGLLGQHLLNTFRENNLPVIPVLRNAVPNEQQSRIADVLDPLALIEAFNGVATVVHTAAVVSFNPRRRKKMLETNVTGTRNVVNACLQAGVKQLIHISSVAAIGKKEGTPLTEDSPWTGMEVSDYAESKYLAELEVFRGLEEGLEVSMVNPSIILSGMQPGRSSAAVLDYVWKGNSFFPSGNINYVDVRDVCQAVLQLMQENHSGERYILSAGSIPYHDFFREVATRFSKKNPSLQLPHALAWIAGSLSEWAGYVLNQEPVLTRQSAAMATRAYVYDNQKAREKLGVSFHSLADTLDWCCGDYMRNISHNK